MQCIHAGLDPYVEALQAALGQPITHASLARLDRALQSFRVLCALRQGPTGTDRINAEVSAWIRQHIDAPIASTWSPDWYPGRVILLTRNDPATGLFNGDLGIALPDSDGMIRVYFPHRVSNAIPAPAGATLDSAPEHSPPKGLPIERLPAHDTAFAMTVHKSQGSEFDQVLLVLADARSPVLTRELLYTGITRARNHVTLAASAAGLRVASERVTSRDSGLADLVIRQKSVGLPNGDAPFSNQEESSTS
jgi:exodeoxyribonuclease V alpha subunit